MTEHSCFTLWFGSWCIVSAHGEDIRTPNLLFLVTFTHYITWSSLAFCFRRKKKCIRFMTGEDGSGSDDDDDDDIEAGGSVATIDSTTDVDGSSQGSPAPSSSTCDDGVQHPLVSQSQPSSSPSHQPDTLTNQKQPLSDSNQSHDSLHSTLTPSTSSLAASSSSTVSGSAVLAT